MPENGIISGGSVHPNLLFFSRDENHNPSRVGEYQFSDKTNCFLREKPTISSESSEAWWQAPRLRKPKASRTPRRFSRRRDAEHETSTAGQHHISMEYVIYCNFTEFFLSWTADLFLCQFFFSFLSVYVQMITDFALSSCLVF